MQFFKELNLPDELLSAIEQMGYKTPSPIQQKAIPLVLQKKDLFACAQTGTGKTAAFALPIITELLKDKKPRQPFSFRALVLLPTRELAEQVAQNMEAYCKFTDIKVRKIYGGVSQKPQVRALEEGVDVVVATPGRLIDLKNQKLADLSKVEFLVLDEADRMLDMGFLPDIRRIARMLPFQRQSLLFSATLSTEVKDLAKFIVKDDAESISIAPDKPTADRIDQKLFFVESEHKFELLKYLVDKTFKDNPDSLILVFSKTKRQASSIAKRLTKAGPETMCIHGDKTQTSRQRSLNMFKSRQVRVLAATDIAARGIDVENMSLVVNYDLPAEIENYVHRIGRTARANLSGVAVSFCCDKDLWLLRPIERLIKKEIPVASEGENPFFSRRLLDMKCKPPRPPSKEEAKNSKKNRTFKRDFGEKRDSFGNFKKKSKIAKLAGKRKM